MITVEQLALSLDCVHPTAERWFIPLTEAMDKWEINTAQRQAGFLATISHESARLQRFEENFNYSVESLARTWPSRFAVDSHSSVLVPNTLAWKLGRTLNRYAMQEEIANTVYSGRMGNTKEGDGYRYRGRGPIQITGFDNYHKCGEAIGLDLVNHPELLLVPENGAQSAGWFWATHGCNERMDEGNFRGATLAVNGGLIGWEDRQKRFALINSTLTRTA